MISIYDITHNNGNEVFDSLEEQLFELVDIYNTGYSQKITGKLNIPTLYAVFIIFACSLQTEL